MKWSLIFVFWLAMAVLISADGFVGYFVVMPKFGEYVNHVYKSAVAVGITALFSWVYAIISKGEGWLTYAVACGVIWVIITTCFEFVAGHYLFGNPWPALFNDYRIWAGRLWVPVLLTSLAGPALMGHFVNLKGK
ncbi:MAG: hypothetical protein JSW52_08035 [Candidatus Coatesbacteria bacterium]|nr:MAG: hypothetical protein JSW52_08035 [Candidatus Coatesbacteria bacterium]